MEEDEVIHIIYVKVPQKKPGNVLPERIYCEESYCQIDYVE